MWKDVQPTYLNIQFQNVVSRMLRGLVNGQNFDTLASLAPIIYCDVIDHVKKCALAHCGGGANAVLFILSSTNSISGLVILSPDSDFKSAPRGANITLTLLLLMKEVFLQSLFSMNYQCLMFPFVGSIRQNVPLC